MGKLEITASIVLYHENIEELSNTIECFLRVNLSKKLYLIDNTDDERYKGLFINDDIFYISNGENLGFGAGHNVILSNITNHSKFHLILNPDVNFESEVIPNLINKLKKHEMVSMIAPKVLFPDGTFQNSCRRYPKVSELLARRFNFLQSIFKRNINKGKYSDKDLRSSFFADYITGCFHLYRTEDFVKLNGFDERYFLYMEDVDICKKIEKMDKLKLYYPKEEIRHVLKQGSSKSTKLFFIHTFSAIKYFLKWGFR
ncbi:galactosyltransferase-related protein [Polaribacter sp. P097]|uniref:galactosyltransferase-related protein n=1 Tax=Polaribacter sp. P097 TaxID=3117398 RepID=UPI002FE3E1FD